MSDTSDYTQTNTYLQILRDEWQATTDLLKTAQIKKDKLNYAIYFLVKHKHLINKTNEEIGEMIGITKQRVGHIYRQVENQLQKKGGDKS